MARIRMQRECNDYARCDRRAMLAGPGLTRC
jgi:hypothetical protein